jgi:hypothetical protein
MRPTFVIAIAVAMMVVPALVQLYTEWLWFGELGYQGIMLRSLTAQWLAGVVGFGVAFLIIAGNWRLAFTAMTQPFLMLGPTTAEVRPLVVERKQVRMIINIAAGLVSLLLGLFMSSQWLGFLRALYGVPFGEADAALGLDAAFYVFSLPALDATRGFLLLATLLALAGSGALFFLAGVLKVDPGFQLTISPQAKRHLSFLAAALFLILAFGAYLDMPRLLVTPGGVIDGASAVDVEARIPLLTILMWVAAGSAILAIVQAFSWAVWPLAAAVAAYLLVSVGTSAYATVVQRFIIAPNEQVRETPYIINNIAATRQAFGLNDVEARQLSGDAALTLADIENNGETIDNVRLWDHQPLLDTFGQIQEIRTYYDFVSVDNDRYVVDGQYRQVMLSARELNSASLPNRTWVNERLVFTHGYGLALGPVNEVTQEGLPVLFVKNLPPESTVDLEVTEPSLYFGELANDHVFVNTRAREFHYPHGDDNEYTTYQGRGGVPIEGLLRRLLFSLRLRSFKVLLSEDITSESRVLLHRNIADRLRTVAPFLEFDADPYLVVSEGRLFWICDAYTVSDSYPYSTFAPNGINYIRNSVKVVVDAYHGTTTFYLADPDDPIARTLERIFPELLRPLDEMPEGLQQHLRYPEGIFSMQTAMYSTFHMTNPAVFYNKEDQWQVPSIDANGNPEGMLPYYTIMKLPGEERAEFIQMLPFTPRGKDNLAAWMVARSDPAHYGKLLVFDFPKQKVVFGPRQIVGRINQDQAISPQITLWNQQGSQVIWGTLLVIPIEESLLYVRPLYLRSAGGRIPELKRVIVAYQNQIVMEGTLAAGLARLFGASDGQATYGAVENADGLVADGPDRGSATVSPEFDALTRQARELYRSALDAQRRGDWARYGDDIQRLGDILERLAVRP